MFLHVKNAQLRWCVCTAVTRLNSASAPTYECHASQCFFTLAFRMKMKRKEGEGGRGGVCSEKVGGVIWGVGG